MLRIFYIGLIALSSVLVACNSEKQDVETQQSEATAEQSQAQQAQSEAQTEAQSSAGLESDAQKLSYGYGFNLGVNIAQQQLPDMNIDALAEGIVDALNERESKVSQVEFQEVMMRVQQAEQAKMEEVAKQNAEDGANFLAENAKKEGVVTTDSGLQYEVLQAGTGATPKLTDIVKAHYHGTLMDGTVFDSSVNRGEPAEFPVNQLIPGWTEALQLMKTGAKWRLYVPSDLAYGESSRGDVIGPNSLLIFEIELIEIVDASAGEDGGSEG